MSQTQTITIPANSIVTLTIRVQTIEENDGYDDGWPEAMTVQEIVRYTHLSERTVYSRIRAGLLTAVDEDASRKRYPRRQVDQMRKLSGLKKEWRLK